MKRRIFCAVMTVVLVLTMLPVVVGAEGGPEITFDPVVAEDGTVEVTVGIANNPGLVTATIPVTWDKNVLTLTDVEASTAVFVTGFCGMTMEEYEVNGTQGVYYLAWDNDTRKDGDFTGNGALAVMTFDVAEGKSGKTAVNSMSADIANLMDFDMNDHWGEVSYSEKEFELGTSGEEDEPDDPGVDADAPQFVVSDTSGLAGEFVTVTVALKNNPGVASIAFNFGYSEEVFEVEEIIYSTVMESNFSNQNNITTQPYMFSYANMATYQNYTGNDILATVKLRIKDNVEVGEYPIVVTHESDWIFDADDNYYMFASDNGVVSVIDYICGDANNDKKVNMQDAFAVAKYFARWDGFNNDTLLVAAMDVNSDGKVNMQDAFAIAKHFARWEGFETLPITNT